MKGKDEIREEIKRKQQKRVEQLRKFLKKNPNASLREMCENTGIHPNYIRGVLHECRRLFKK